MRCRGQIDVKVVQNTKWMVTKKRRNPPKRGVGKKKKNVMMVLDRIDPGAHPRRL
jgi:hypothetical protein